MSVSYRKKTINEIAKEAPAPTKPAAPVSVDFYGEDVFNTEAMREYLPKDVCEISVTSKPTFTSTAARQKTAVALLATLTKRLLRPSRI